ncbi:MAG: CoA pyrophosphatase [Pseudomonadota bacterium]
MSSRMPHRTQPSHSAAPAAVLIVLKREADAWHVLFIRRSTRDDDRHSGQVAFPGGRVEEGDRNLTDTALREAEEEIGLPREKLSVIAQLPDSDTSTGFVVTPVVAILRSEFEPVLQKAEVARLFSMPLDWLRNPDNHWSRLWRNRPVVYFKDYDGENLWGATARMTITLVDSIESGDLVLPA